MKDIKLLPCPFCGEIPCFSYRDRKINVMCCINGCRGEQIAAYSSQMYTTEEEAAAAWNTRKPMDRIVEQLEEKKKRYEEEKQQSKGLDRAIFNNYKKIIDKAIDIVKEVTGYE